MSNPHRAPDDDAVAWGLAAAARPHLSRVEADRIYIAIGVGDTFEAIEDLLGIIARDRIPLGDDLVATVSGWLDCYRGRDSEERLRQLLAQVNSTLPDRVWGFEDRRDAAANTARDRRSG